MEIYQFSVNDSTIYWLSCQTSQTAQKYNDQKNYTQQNEKVHSHKRKSLSLFQSGYIQLQSVVSSITSWKHSVQAVPSNKKKNFRKKRGKENEVEKRRRRKKGWKEFVRKREKQMWKKRRNKKGENEMVKKKKKKGRKRERRRGRKRRKERKRKKNIK